jgi:hypothetical protein
MLPEEIIQLMEQFARDMSRLNCGVFGLVYRLGPESGMGILRNTTGDPVQQAQAVLSLVRDAKQDGRILEKIVGPTN